MTIKGKLILAAILGGALAGVLIGPSLVDWTQYKQRIESPIEAALGRQVSIDGPLSLSLLPTPRLSAKGVRLANPSGAATPDMARLDALDIRLRLLPLLQGRFEVSSLVLQSPDIDLERLPDGSANWHFQPQPKEPQDKASPSSAATTPAGESRHNAVTINDVSIESGRITYRDGKGAPMVLDGVNARLSRDANSGELQISGSGQADGIALALDAQADGWPDGAAPIGLSSTLHVGDNAGQLHLSGQATGGTDAPAFTGKLTIKAADLSQLGAALGWRAALPTGALSIDTPLTADAKSIDAKTISLSLGDMLGSGHLTADLGAHPHFDGQLAFTRIDLDQLLAHTARRDVAQPIAPAATRPTNAVHSAMPPQPSTQAAAEAPLAFSLPKGFGATIDLSSDAVIWHGGLLRNAHLNADLTDGDLMLNQASVTLPGESDLNLFGYVGVKNGHPSFDGSFEAGTDNLRVLMNWLAIKAGRVPADRLRTARLAGKIAADPSQVRLDGVQLHLDGAQIAAAADLRLGGPRPALGASFAIDTLNLDAYLPPKPAETAAQPTAAVPQPAPTTNDLPAAAKPAASEPALARPFWLDGIDANLKGRVGQLITHGTTANNLALDVSWLDGDLTLHDLSVGDLAGSRIKLAGGLADLDQPTPCFKSLDWTVQSPALGRLLLVAGINPGFDADRLGQVVLSGSLDGTPNDLSIQAASEISGLTVHADGKVQGGMAAPHLDLSVAASHSSTMQVLQLLGLDYHPNGPLGAFAATTHLRGDRSALQFADLRLATGPLTAAGEADLTLSGAKPRLDVTLSANDFPLDPFLPSKRHADAGPRLRDMINQGLLIPTRGVPIHFVSAHGPEPTPPKAAPRPSVAVGRIPSNWSRTPLDLSWLNQMDGSLKLNALALTWGHTRFEQPALAATLSNGTLSLDSLAAQLWSGHLTGTGKLSADGQAVGDATLTHAQAHEAVLGLAGLDVAQGVMDGGLSLKTHGQSQAEMIERLAGNGKIAVTDGVLRGFDLKAVDQRLRSVDGPLALLGLLQAGLSGGSTRFTNLSGTFQINDGIISSKDLTMTADGGGAKAEGSANLPNNAIDARAQFHLDSATQAPPLVVRLTGPLDHPRRFVDINGIQGWLAQRGLDKPVKGKAATAARNLLKELLGRQGEPAPASSGSNQEQPQKIKPKDMLKGLLQGLH